MRSAKTTLTSLARSSDGSYLAKAGTDALDAGQVARELSATRTVDLAVGTRIPAVPQRPLGRDVWWWGSRLRLDRVTADSRLGRRLAARDQIMG